MSLQEIGVELNCDKFSVHKFGDVYERYFRALRHQPIKILEIGIGGEGRELGGASLRTWERYFTKALIFGIDLHDKSSLDTDRIKTIVMDQADQEALEELWRQHGPFDVVIDDGSHVSEDILRSFFKMFHLLAAGGIYVIEDIQTGYWPHYGGTSVNQNLSNTSISWIKRMVDCINVEEILWKDHPAVRSGFVASELHVHRNIAFVVRGDIAPPSNVLDDERRKEWLESDFRNQGMDEGVAFRLNNDVEYMRHLARRLSMEAGESAISDSLSDSDITKGASVSQEIFGPAHLDGERTYIIVGNGRGGTSMVAGVAAALGLPITSDKHSVNFEDAEIVNAAQGRDPEGRKLNTSASKDIKNVLDVIRKRNESLPVWGWKDPSADMYLEKIARGVRNPHIICVWRDLTAVASSHLALEQIHPFDAFEMSFSRYERYWRLLKKFKYPTLMVSYERGRSRPAEMAREIAAFIGLPYHEDVERKVLEFVSPNGGYRQLS